MNIIRHELPTNVLVDNGIKEEILKLSGWRVDNRGYCSRRVKRDIAGKQVTMLLHRFIIENMYGTSSIKNRQIDHINGNKLDNRIENLRICTQAENNRNRTKSSRNRSGFKGVSWDKLLNKWRAQITYNYETVYIDSFEDKVAAAIAYDNKAKELFGEFANTNF